MYRIVWVEEGKLRHKLFNFSEDAFEYILNHLPGLEVVVFDHAGHIVEVFYQEEGE